MSISRRQFTIIACAMAILLGSIVFAVVRSGNNSARPKVEAHVVSQEICYVLRDYDGKLAVFHKEGLEPVEVFDVFVESLPEMDREILRNGLETTSKKQLLLWIEDYIG